MEPLIFEDYMRPDTEHQMYASNIKALTLKQISRGRFEIVDNQCVVTILLNNEKITVILSNKINIEDFRNQIYIVDNKEPSLDFLYKNISIDEPLLTSLQKYQDQFYNLGTEFNDEYWYKFYSKTEIEDDMRTTYQASWIDYEKQLEEDSIIYDELGICGLWAMPNNMLFQCFNKECKKRYGNNLFILKPVPECRYINDGKEIIGDRYKVLKKYNLNSFKDIGKLIADMISLERNKYDIKMSELNAKIKDLETENAANQEALQNSQNNLKDINKKIQKCKLLKWLFLLIGIICGIMMYKFI